MLAILATQEAEIRKIAVQSQPRQIAFETLSLKKFFAKKKKKKKKVFPFVSTLSQLIEK
jgi:hypothetical protein